jgi:hypothetical protein
VLSGLHTGLPIGQSEGTKQATHLSVPVLQTGVAPLQILFKIHPVVVEDVVVVVFLALMRK